MAIRFGMAGCLDPFSSLRLAQFVELRQIAPLKSQTAPTPPCHPSLTGIPPIHKVCLPAEGEYLI